MGLSLGLMTWDKGTKENYNIGKLHLLFASPSARCLAFIVYFILMTIL